MFNDISFGQYYPAKSIVHKTDPRMKIVVMVLLLVFIFLARNFISMALMTAAVFVAALLSKIPLRLFFKNLKAVLPIIVIASLLNIFYVKEGNILIKWHFITVSTGGLERAVFILVRIILLIVVGGLLTYTTTPTQLTAAMESLFSPLKLIGLGEGVHTMAMMMTIALRFIPTLIEEAQKIISAQKARGADFETGGIFKRGKALIPILIPLLISSVRRALELADAMECRCYAGGKGRTHLNRFVLQTRDYAALAVSIIICTAIILINTYF